MYSLFNGSFTDISNSEQAESKLRFLGLIIFENKIKAGTAPAIHALRNAHLACRMITGDNPLTAVSVARECGLVNPAAYVFSPSFVRGRFFQGLHIYDTYSNLT